MLNAPWNVRQMIWSSLVINQRSFAPRHREKAKRLALSRHRRAVGNRVGSGASVADRSVFVLSSFVFLNECGYSSLWRSVGWKTRGLSFDSSLVLRKNSLVFWGSCAFFLWISVLMSGEPDKFRWKNREVLVLIATFVRLYILIICMTVQEGRWKLWRKEVS